MLLRGIGRTIEVGAFAAIAALLLVAIPAEVVAQDVFQGEGYEAFPMIDYKGGDSQYKKKGVGILVLTDTTLGFYNCRWANCMEHKGTVHDPAKPIWVHPLKQIVSVSASTTNRGPSVTGRVMFGVLATDARDEHFAFTYESETTAEAPVFKTPKHMAAQLEAKVRFRLKKLGVVLPE